MPRIGDPFERGQTAQVWIGVNRRAVREPTALLDIAIPFLAQANTWPFRGQETALNGTPTPCFGILGVRGLLQRSLFLFSLRLSVGLQ